MDYEKKYKELVAKIKNAHLYAQTDSTKAVLEGILPELAESEDEKSNLIYGACASQIAMETRCKEEAYNDVLSCKTFL